jgi:exodeoxyribonuclease V alpha subunit
MSAFESVLLRLLKVQGLDAQEQTSLAQLGQFVWEAWHAGHTAWPVASLPEPLKAICTHRLLAPGPIGAPIQFPLVCEYGFVFLYRNWQAESTLAKAVLARYQTMVAQVARAPVQAQPSLSEEQQAAAQAICTRPLVLLSGGPGTGKTATIAAALASLMAQVNPPRVAACAPTGKAAARMQEALSTYGVDAFQVPCSTIHRLLATEGETLDQLDLLVVDEASMLDLELSNRLLAALPAHTRLVLAGDANQLASVEPGAVFAQLTEALTCHELSTNFRAKDTPALAALVAAVKAGSATAFLAALKQADGVGVTWLDSDTPTPHWWRQQLQEPLAFLTQAEIDLPSRLAYFKVLGAQYKGESGVDQLNAMCAQKLAPHHQASVWFSGALVMNQKNDSLTGLSNGDIGWCQGEPLSVQFAQGDAVVQVAPSQVVGASLAFALTVHKAQGSEYQHVIFVAAPQTSPQATRELLYTGISRARKRLTLVGSEASLLAALATPTQRYSALRLRLEENA